MTDDTMVLAGDFPPPTQEEWEREVLKVLNRRRPPGTELTIDQAMKRLTTTLVDGVVIDPVYWKPDDQVIGYPDQTPFTRGSELPHPEAPWMVTQLHEDGDVARTSAAILDDLDAGGTAVWLRVDADAIAVADVPAVLDGVLPDAAAIAVSSVGDQEGAAQALLDFFAAKGAKEPKGNLGIDPIGASAATGRPADLGTMKTWADKASHYNEVSAFVADVRVYDNAGAGDIDQVAFAIATGIEYVRALTDQGMAPHDAFCAITFRVTANADEFLTVARLRALRRLWARVGEVLGVPEPRRGAIQHAVTSWRILSKVDPWVNLLRATIGAFSMAVGGAQLMTTLPHDTPYGLPTKFSRRIARNIQLLVAEESHIGAVEDPAGGAWVFESLTEQLATKAWSRVQEIEAMGGMSVALSSGKAAEWIATASAERDKRLATRKLPLTGVSMFPKDGEEPLTDFIERPAGPQLGGLEPHRDSEVFESLRDRARTFEKAHKKKPAVLMACLGTRRDFGGREGFTSNLLMVGGLDYPEIEGATSQDIVSQAKDKEIPMVILASSATVYQAQGLEVAKACKAAGLDVWIAGRKTEIGSDEANDQIDGEIFDGMDVVTFLSSTLDKLGA